MITEYIEGEDTNKAGGKKFTYYIEFEFKEENLCIIAERQIEKYRKKQSKTLTVFAVLIVAFAVLGYVLINEKQWGIFFIWGAIITLLIFIRLRKNFMFSYKSEKIQQSQLIDSLIKNPKKEFFFDEKTFGLIDATKSVSYSWTNKSDYNLFGDEFAIYQWGKIGNMIQLDKQDLGDKKFQETVDAVMNKIAQLKANDK